MTPHAILFTLAAIGISETVYLIKKRKLDEKPVCFFGANCMQVLDSKYNKMFGIHNDILGLLFYLGMTVVTALLVLEVEPVGLWNMIVRVSVAAGVIMSTYFTFLQWKVIKVWCFWCLMSAFTIFAMLITILMSNLIL